MWKILNKKKKYDDISYLEGSPIYLILGLWAFICLFPIYWVVITSFKEAYVVNDGPFYIPFVDFQPSLHAWEFVLMQESVNTLRPFYNTIIISIISALIAVFIGSMAGYALVRISYRPKIASIMCFLLLLAGSVFLIVKLKIDFRITLISSISIFVLFLLTLSRKFKSSLGNNDIGF